ncbi:hypothetical protein IGS60_18485 [Janthinobacterium sp. FW305-128]|nr:hypothetical protein [Janthinobacterium sp. FW305-128]
MRYDWLAHYLFEMLEDIEDLATRWLWTCNHDRPNTTLDAITPKQKLAMAAQALLLTRSKNRGMTIHACEGKWPNRRHTSSGMRSSPNNRSVASHLLMKPICRPVHD